MSTITTKADIYDKTATLKTRVWKSLTLGTGDVLKTGLKLVTEVHTSKPASVTSWSASGGDVTFTLGGAIVGPVIVRGRG